MKYDDLKTALQRRKHLIYDRQMKNKIEMDKWQIGGQMSIMMPVGSMKLAEDIILNGSELRIQ